MRWTIAAEFAEAIGAAAYQQSVGYGSHFLVGERRATSVASRDQKNVRKVLSQYDLMIVLGADPVRMSVYESRWIRSRTRLPVVQIGLVDWDIAKNYAVEMGVKADVGGDA